MEKRDGAEGPVAEYEITFEDVVIAIQVEGENYDTGPGNIEGVGDDGSPVYGNKQYAAIYMNIFFKVPLEQEIGEGVDE